MNSIIDSGLTLTGSWADISFEAVKQDNGTVIFDDISGAMDRDAIGLISPDLEARFEP